jgi:hypothetical protein
VILLIIFNIVHYYIYHVIHPYVYKVYAYLLGTSNITQSYRSNKLYSNISGTYEYKGTLIHDSNNQITYHVHDSN